MSWEGFKKAINRAGGEILDKNVDKTIDKDFDLEERRYKVLKNAGQELQKASKAYLDALRVTTASQLTIAEIFSHLHADTTSTSGSAYSTVGAFYLQSVRDIDEETVKQVDDPFRETILEPVNKFANYFNEIDEAIKKRIHKKTDYDQCKAKVRRLIDKPSKDASKLPRAEKELAMAKEIYDGLNEQLKAELPQLISLRVPFLDPSFESLVKIQMKFCTESYLRLAQVQQFLDTTDREDYANGVLDARIDDLLTRINGLSIASLPTK